MTITQWFEQNDPYFEHPFRVMNETWFSLSELREEYDRTFYEDYAEEMWKRDFAAWTASI